MTANKQKKAKITIEQLSIYTSINYKIGVLFSFKLLKKFGMGMGGGTGRREGGVRKNIRSGEPVQNMIMSAFGKVFTQKCLTSYNHMTTLSHVPRYKH